MIKKVTKLKNYGILQDATQFGPIDLTQTNIIYAENGRGKSALASMFRACTLGNAARVIARQTLDSPGPQEIEILVDMNGQIQPIKFENASWSGVIPKIEIFDAEFVEQNVYSGFEVRPEQRQSLLEFVLGDQAIKLKQRIDRLTHAIDRLTTRRTQLEKELTGYASPIDVAKFIKMPLKINTQQRLDMLQKRLEAAKKAKQLATRQNPSLLPLLAIDIPNMFDIFMKKIEDVEEVATRIVRTHLAEHQKEYFEDWVSRGQDYMNLVKCPFCGQPLEGLELIRAYRIYFSKAYKTLKSEIAKLKDTIDEQLSESKIEAFNSIAEINTARIEAWKDQLTLTIRTFPRERISVALKHVYEYLRRTIHSKQQAPLEIVGSPAECEKTIADFNAVNEMISDYNREISEQIATIEAFTEKLAGEDVGILEKEVAELNILIKRQLPEVIALVIKYQKVEKEKKKLDDHKVQVRNQLDTLMKTTLRRYETIINDLLEDFGADFSIVQMESSYVGTGEPRTDYALSIRNKTVRLGSRTDIGSSCCFGTTLSESDKRTVAFAFFVARLVIDPDLGNKIIIFDDPISSFDRSRRDKSLCLIMGLANRCRQIIILAHDPYFLRELCERLEDIKPTPIIPSMLQIKRVQNNYSALKSGCSIEDICASVYYTHYRMICDFVDGRSNSDLRNVAKAIRPLLEGYYRRRFPRCIPRKSTLGLIIGGIRDSTKTEPLAYLKRLLSELTEINEYACQFMHDTNPNADAIPINEGELLTKARQTLDFIYKNG